MNYYKHYFNGKCKNCDKEMNVDDIGYYFEGCQDEFWICPHCDTTVYIKVRYNHICKSVWHKSELYSIVRKN